MSPESVKCSMFDLNEFGNASHPVAYNYTIELSNNEVNFAEVNTTSDRSVWHSGWIWMECLKSGNHFPKVIKIIADIDEY